ncbi:MAG: 8-oxo-dGTP diphosphatase [Cyclobacteriaceae bacterium]|jgi:8-oxo-dGTP pyrophosphatase MutT (NUDIX family)
MAMEIDKLALISISDKKVLMTRSKGKPLFYLPGGKREMKETDFQALKREVSEELKVDLIDTSIKYMNTFKTQADGKPVGVLVKMTCYTANYIDEPIASSEIEEIQWMDMSHYEEIAEVDKMIFEYLKLKQLIR